MCRLGKSKLLLALKMKPEKYWEERCDAVEGLVERLMLILAQSQPMIQPHLVQLQRQWNSIREQIDRDYAK